MFDIYGSKLPMAHTKGSNRSIYYTSYPHLLFSSNNELFEENLESYSFSIAYIDLIEKDDLPSKYASSDWIAFTANVLSPSGRKYKIDL